MAHSSDGDRLVVYIFGDQTYDVADAIQNLSQTNGDVLLGEFLSRSCAVLHEELSRLPAHQRQRCPPFTSLVDLMEPYKRGTINAALVQSLTCIAQIGIFLRQVSSGCQEYPTKRESVVVGICTGSLAATAVSSAHSATSLIAPVGIRRTFPGSLHLTSLSGSPRCFHSRTSGCTGLGCHRPCLPSRSGKRQQPSFPSMVLGDYRLPCGCGGESIAAICVRIRTTLNRHSLHCCHWRAQSVGDIRPTRYCARVSSITPWKICREYCDAYTHHGTLPLRHSLQ